jgi:glycosidase
VNHHRAAVAAGQDPAEMLAALRAKSRDNARTPMQWTLQPWEARVLRRRSMAARPAEAYPG